MTNLLTIENWQVDKLVPYARNPRKNDDVVDRMCGAIREFGFRIPIVAKSDGTVVDGHLRLKAALKLGFTTVPVVLADDLTDAQIKAFRLLANQSANWAEWDEELLKLELEDLQHLDFDLDLTGFDLSEIERLLEIEAQDGLTDDDAAPAVNEESEPITKTGDVWIMGEHRLICGDSTLPETLERLLSGSLVDMVFTDPPYNVNYGETMKDSLRGKNGNKNYAGSKPGRKIMNDNLGDEFYGFLLKACQGFIKVCKGAIYICMSSSELHSLHKAFLESGGHWSTFIIWSKNHFTMGKADYQRQYEPILYGWPEGSKHYWCGDRNQSDVWPLKRPQINDLHPTMKPVELVQRAIENSSKSRGIILDPFGGSGSTLIACEKTGRSARLVELDPKYCDVIVKRWQEYSGKEAVLENAAPQS
jgi:DNA modification methylase